MSQERRNLILVALAVILLLAMTNPDQDTYQGCLAAKLGTRTPSSSIAATFVAKVLTTRHNYILFSVFETNFGGQQNYVFGVLGECIQVR